MDFVKRYPILSTVLALCVAAFAVELFFLWKFNKNVTTLQAQVKSSKSAADSAQQKSPAPSQQNLTDATKNVDDLKAELADVQKALSDTTLKIDNIPTKDFDLLSQIQGYKTSMNDKAKEKGILLPNEDYSFGMSLYVGRGVSAPPEGKFPAVFKQMKVLDYILSHLMDDAKLPDQKMKIVSIEREDVTAIQAASGAPAAASEPGTNSSPDIFVVPGTITARVPGAINTLAFRIKFIAYSESLRILLSDLAKFEYPLVVRSVEVEPAAVDRALTGVPAASNNSKKGSNPADNPASKPIVTENYSQFTVVVEYIELPSANKPVAADAAATNGTAPAAASGTTAASGTSH